MVVAVFFCSESLERLEIDKYPSLISNFKMATARLVRTGQIFSPAAAS